MKHEFVTTSGGRDRTGRYFGACTCGKKFSGMDLGAVIRRMGKHMETGK